jgi:Fe-S-cluster containining protein
MAGSGSHGRVAAPHDDDDHAPSSARVHLLAGRPLFFPFPSGALVYRCEGCDAPCCKGEPLGIGRSRELVTILQAQPKAAMFAAPGFNGGPLVSITPPPEKCWFLDSKQRCRLEHVLGREHKPTGCRLFPFSVLQGVGEALAIVPDLLCPIQTAAPSSTGPTSWDALAVEMTRTQVPRTGHVALEDPPDLPWREALVLERRLVQEAGARLAAPSPGSALSFFELSHQLTCALVGVDARPAAMAVVDADVRRFLGVHDELSEAATRDLLTFAGVLRLRPIDGLPVPRRAIPPTLVALAVLFATFDSMRGSRRSVRSLASLWDAQGPALYALAHLGARPLPGPGLALDEAVARLGTQRPAFHDVIEGIRHNGRRSIAITVEELLRIQRETFAPPLTVDAMAMLHGLGRVLREACTFTPI